MHHKRILHLMSSLAATALAFSGIATPVFAQEGEGNEDEVVWVETAPEVVVRLPRVSTDPGTDSPTLSNGAQTVVIEQIIQYFGRTFPTGKRSVRAQTVERLSGAPDFTSTHKTTTIVNGGRGEGVAVTSSMSFAATGEGQSMDCQLADIPVGEVKSEIQWRPDSPRSYQHTHEFPKCEEIP